MGSCTSSSNSDLNSIKIGGEKQFYASEFYQDFLRLTNSQNFIEEENSLKNLQIVAMMIFHSYVNFPSITTSVVHTYCFLIIPELMKQNKVILIEYGGYYGFSKSVKETPHYPLGNGYRYIIIMKSKIVKKE